MSEKLYTFEYLSDKKLTIIVPGNHVFDAVQTLRQILTIRPLHTNVRDWRLIEKVEPCKNHSITVFVGSLGLILVAYTALLNNEFQVYSIMIWGSGFASSMLLRKLTKYLSQTKGVLKFNRKVDP